MAANLVSGRGLIDNMGNLAHYNPGYPLLLAPAFMLFGATPRTAWAVNALLGGFSVFLVAAVAYRGGRRAGPALLAAGLWVGYVEAYVYGAYLAKENLMILLLLGQVLLCTRFADWPHQRAAAALLGFLTGAQALAGSAGLAVVPVLIAAICLGSRPWRRRAGLLFLFTAGVLTVVGPWVYRNHAVLGSAVLNTNGGFNLYLGNNPSATGFFVSISDTPLGGEWRELRQQGEVVAERAAAAAARDFILNNPGRALDLAMRKAAYFWLPPVHEGKRQSHPAEPLIRKLWLVEYLALGTLALLSLALFHRGDWSLLWPVPAAIVFYWLIHTPFYVIFRYRLPVMPLVTLLAALAAASVLERFERWWKSFSHSARD
jgi:hypothetical protein